MVVTFWKYSRLGICNSALNMCSFSALNRTANLKHIKQYNINNYVFKVVFFQKYIKANNYTGRLVIWMH